MLKFLPHDAIASGFFNRSYNSGHGVYSPWESVLQNTLPLTELLAERLASDFVGLSCKMRKPWSSKDVEAHLHSVPLPWLQFLVFSSSAVGFWPRKTCSVLVESFWQG